MVLRKTKPYLPVTKGDETEGTRAEAFQLKGTDHWSFLDEIEAPMWADLTSGTNFTYRDKEDEWFNITHPFHQFSSRQLISAFSRSAEGPTSPQLPLSISRSRGKHYRTKEWGQQSKKYHPVKNLVGKSSWASSGSSSNETKEPKPRNKESNRPNPKASLVSESRLTKTSEPNDSKVSSFQDSKPNSGSIVLKSIGESVVVSSQILGQSQTSELLSSLKVGFRKSCVTRQASRMVEKNVPRKSEGCKYSSSSKSSLGSSSNLGFGGKNLRVNATQNDKEETPDSRNATRIWGAASKKIVIGTNKSRDNIGQVRDVSSSARFGRVAIASKSQNQETTKAKVQCSNTLRGRGGLGAHRVNQQGRLVATKKAEEKVKTGLQNGIADSGKENYKIGKIAISSSQKYGKENYKIGKIAISSSQKYGAKENPTGGVETSSRPSIVPQKAERKKMVGLKERSNCQLEGKNRTNFVQKVYFR